MNVKVLLLTSNPFVEAYVNSDFLGKGIFFAIFAASIFSWVLIFLKGWQNYLSRQYSNDFYKYFLNNRAVPLKLDCESGKWRKEPNPFLAIYRAMKKETVDVLNKNRRFGDESGGTSYLSTSDVSYIESHLVSTVAKETQKLDKNLFILSTVVSLAPFLGLLGTVLGILLTFSELQTHSAGGTQSMMLSGLSLALATTVLGLITAIPALIGYNALKNSVADFETDMEVFASEVLAAVEIQYRKVV